MKPKILYNNDIAKLSRYGGIMLWPFILFSYKKENVTKTLMQHELIHFAQANELLVLGWYLLYGLEYIWNLCRTLSHREAYESISFEKEAYINDDKQEYLKYRKRFAWFKY